MRGLRDRSTVIIVALLLAVVGAGMWRSWADRADLAVQLEESQSQQSELATAVGTLAGQVEALGGDPAVTIETLDDGPEVVEGPAGPRGPRGRAGSPGSDGSDGESGPAGVPGSDGQDGQDGADGEDGADGSDGSDGAAGAAGDAGDVGAPGPRGSPGPPGEPGEPGPPPESFSFTWDSITWLCTDPNGTMHYECAPTNGDSNS